jgi:hypothetical protein
MPIVLLSTDVPNPSVQDIVNCVSQDVRAVLAATGNDANILLDYINRTQYSILRYARWQFILSAPQYFITERQQTDYWIGPVGLGPLGIVDTGLNLIDVDRIKLDSVVDLSNDKVLAFTAEKDFKPVLTFQDAQSRPGRPASWRQDFLSKDIISILPAPDNSSLYQPVPQASYLTITPGGALPKRIYYVRLTFVDAYNNEGTPSSTEGIITIPANFLVTVNPPQLPFAYSAESATAAAATTSTYNQYNIYASTTSLAEKLQNVTPLLTTVPWTEPTTGLTTTGVAPPTTSNLTVMDGYIITFRYYQERALLTTMNQLLQVPIEYKDIVCAGVNHLATQYLRLKDEAQMWYSIFQDGLRQMIKDKNLQPRGIDYMQPDEYGVGIGQRQPYVDTFDLFR